MNTLKYKDYEGTAELDMARNVCRGKIMFIDDLVTYESDLPAGLQAEFEAAVDDYLETCAAVGKKPLRPFRGLFNVRVGPALHRAALRRALVDGISLNEVVVRALDAFVIVHTDAGHDVRVIFEPFDAPTRIVTAVASEKLQWGKAHVH